MAPTTPGWHTGPMLGLAVATTGPNTDTDHLVAVTLVAVNGARPFSHTWTIRPDGYTIPTDAANIHGISTGRATRHGRPAHDVLREVILQIARAGTYDVPLVAFNAPFALSFIAQAAEHQGIAFDPAAIDVIDPLVLEQHSNPHRSNTLDNLAKIYKIQQDTPHGKPENRARAALRVAYKYAVAHPRVAKCTPAALHLLQKEWNAEVVDEFNAEQALMDRVARRSPAWPLTDYAYALTAS